MFRVIEEQFHYPKCMTIEIKSVLVAVQKLKEEGNHRAGLAMLKPLLNEAAKNPRSQDYVELQKLHISLMAALRDIASAVKGLMTLEKCECVSNQEILRSIAEVLLASGAQKSSVTLYRILHKEYSSESSYADLVMVLLAATQREEARTLAQRGAKAYPDDENLSALSHQFNQMFIKGDKSLPIQTYTGKFAKRSRIFQGRLLLHAEAFDLAVEQFQSLLLDYPNDGNSYFWLSLALLHQQRYPEAMPLLKEAIRIMPQAYSYQNLLIKTYRNAGRRVPIKVGLRVFYVSCRQEIAKECVIRMANRLFPQLRAAELNK